jgi:DNA (cytosine-5)-methyltransferase 1
MAARPRLLDLFCGAGGAAVGYHRAGFDIVGVDIKPQKNYPFAFVQGDALDYCREHGHEFEAIHASPPCQGPFLYANDAQRPRAR